MLEPADGLFGTLVTEEWIKNEFLSRHGIHISCARFQRVGDLEGSFSRICLMECESGGRLPPKLIVKIPTCLTYVENRQRRGWSKGDFSHVKDLLVTYHNTETLFYNNVDVVAGVPRVFLTQPLTDSDDRGVICMEYVDNAKTRPVYEDLSVNDVKSILDVYTDIQYGCFRIPDNVSRQLNKGVFGLLSTTTLSVKTLKERLAQMTKWAPEMSTTMEKLVQLLPAIVDHDVVTRLRSECPFRRLFVHGDLYSSNVLWRSGKVVALIDYQMVHFGNPVEDLLRLFTTGLEPSSRKAHTMALLQHYCHRLISLLPEYKDQLTLEKLLQWYRKMFPMAGLWTMVSLYASFEAATSQNPSIDAWRKAVANRIHAVAAEIVDISTETATSHVLK